MKYERLNTEKFIERAKKTHGNKYDYSNTIYVVSKVKLEIICKECGNKWKTLPHNHLKGNGCKVCVYKNLPQNQPRSHEEFVRLAKKVHGNKFDYIEKYTNNRKNINIKCNVCENVFKQRPGSHLEGTGCRFCVYKKLIQNQPKSFFEFEQQCKKEHDNKYEYCGDYKGGKKKIKIFCKKHEEYFMQNASAHLLKKQGCPKCNFSRGEIKIEKFLKSKNIKFEHGKKFEDCKLKLSLPFDFYLADYNLCIEYDGQQHHSPISYFGGVKRFKEYQKKDKIKTNYCSEKKIDLIRIPFWEYDKIEEILEKKIRFEKCIT
ncbi:MAG: hypothetical protein EKK64_02035 [Neisseriaceae bacterium]|nr:MAG: hypothetical protein EKK64_02035 [Neisseriaceae bacterium]